MTGIARQQIRAQQQQADCAFVFSDLARQVSRVRRQTIRHARVVNADLGVLDRRGRFGGTAQGFAVAVGVAVHQEANQVGHVLFRTAQPILHGQKVRAHILRRARNKAQHLRNAAQHFHLRGTACTRLFFTVFATSAAQLFQHGHRAAGRLAHVELAQLGELHHFTRRHHAHHGVAGIAAGLERGQDGQEVVFQKHGGGNDDVALLDVGNAARGGLGVAGVFRRCVQREVQPGHVAHQRFAGTVGGAGQMGVHRDQHDSDGRMQFSAHLFSAKNGLWRHTKSLW